MPDTDGLSAPIRLPMLSLLRGVGLLPCGGDKFRCRNVLYRCDRMEEPKSREGEVPGPRVDGLGALKDRGDRLGAVDLRPHEGLDDIDGLDRLEPIDGLGVGRLGLIEGLRLGDGALGRGDGEPRRLAILSRMLLRREPPGLAWAMIDGLLLRLGIEKLPRWGDEDRLLNDRLELDPLDREGLARRLEIRLWRARLRDCDTDDLLGADRDDRALRRPSTVGAVSTAKPMISATVAAKRSFLSPATNIFVLLSINRRSCAANLTSPSGLTAGTRNARNGPVGINFDSCKRLAL